MKPITAYIADHDPHNPQIKKSSALAMDARHLARAIAESFHTQSHSGTTELLMSIIAAGVTPGRLYRQYRKLYRVKVQYDAAIAEEHIQDEAPPF